MFGEDLGLSLVSKVPVDVIINLHTKLLVCLFADVPPIKLTLLSRSSRKTSAAEVSLVLEVFLRLLLLSL